MPRAILVVEPQGESKVLREVAAHDEEQLQERLKANPDLLPIEDFELAGPLMVVGRETSLPSGSVDLVGMARGGELLVIEFKTGPQNPDFRHSLAQLLDYGSDLWGMSYDEFESTVARTYFTGQRCPPNSPTYRAASLIEAAAATWPELTDEELSALQDRLRGQLDRGGFHYVVVAQRFVPTMEQTLAYLNSAMPEARFYAVELVRFVSGEVSAFEARTVLGPGPRGRGGRGGQGTTTGEQRLLEQVVDPSYRQALEELLEACRGLRFRFEWGTAGVSVRLPTADTPEPLTVGWLFPPGRSGWMGLTDLTLGYDEESARTRPSLRQSLDRYAVALEGLPGAEPVRVGRLRAFRLPPEVIVAHQTAIVERLGALVQQPD
jgi:hypothetical protein